MKYTQIISGAVFTTCTAFALFSYFRKLVLSNYRALEIFGHFFTGSVQREAAIRINYLLIVLISHNVKAPHRKQTYAGLTAYDV